MAIKITKKTKVILLSVLGVLFLSGTGFLIWRVTQEETVAPEDSEAGLTQTECENAGCVWYVVGGETIGCVGQGTCRGKSDDETFTCDDCNSDEFCYDGWMCCDKCTVPEPPPDEPVDCTDRIRSGDTSVPIGQRCIGKDPYTYECGVWCYTSFNGPDCCVDEPIPCTCGYYTHDGVNSCGVTPCAWNQKKETRECTGDCSPEDYYKCTVDNICTCGNGVCDSNESISICPEDCTQTCSPGCTPCISGDRFATYYINPPSGYKPSGTCTYTNEDCSTDEGVICYSSCGNNVCDNGETASSCSEDCTTEQDCLCGRFETIDLNNCNLSPCNEGFVKQFRDCQGDCDPTMFYRCVEEDACSIQDDCICSNWSSGTNLNNCGVGTCDDDEVYQTRDCVDNCDVEYQCTYNSDCIVTPEETCGNGVCDGDDTLENCPQDCHVCPDTYCTKPYENATSCPQDCTECGDGLCTNGETAHDCPQDCDPVCPDGYCTHDENPSTCPLDCSAVCPDGYCTHSETALSCPADCDSECGDGSCTHEETAVTCPEDCDPDCGDGACTGDENAFTCPKDCDADCGDGFCTHTENANTCPADCDAVCGDGYCTGDETASSCPSDCDPDCGDGACTHDETVNSCPEDCDASCGDGYCTGDENQTNCPIDCGTASGPTPQTGIFDTVISKIVAGILLILIGINWGSITRTFTKLNYTTKEKIMDRKLEKFERKVGKKK
jgi:hypothetical protein